MVCSRSSPSSRKTRSSLILLAETQQKYYRCLLLSDYEDTIGSLSVSSRSRSRRHSTVRRVNRRNPGWGRRKLHHTAWCLDAASGESGWVRPGVQSCYNTWKAINAPPKNKSPFIEEQGPIVGWCQVITLFADAGQEGGARPDETVIRRSDGDDQELPGDLDAASQL